MARANKSIDASAINRRLCEGKTVNLVKSAIKLLPSAPVVFAPQ